MDTPERGTDEGRPALPPDVGRRRADPADEAEDPTGASAGALGEIGDPRSARAFAEVVLDTVKEGLLFLDLDLRVRGANASFYRLLGVTPEESIGRHVYDLGCGPWALPALRALREAPLSPEEPFHEFDVEHTFEGLGRRVLTLRARRLDDHQTILLAIEDVTEQHLAHAALRENEERLRRAQKAAHVGTWDINLVTGEVSWSEGVFDLVGLPSEEGVPSADSWSALLHPADRERVDQQVRTAIERAGSYEQEFRVVRPDGEVVWIAAKGHVLRDEEGRPVRLLGANYDITPRKRTEEALRQMNETLEERVAARTLQVREHEQQIRGLSRALALAEQEERRRIAHILHDDLQQILFGAQLAAYSGDTAHLMAVLDEAIEVTRTLSHGLSPPLLEGDDTEDLIEWIAERSRRRHGLNVAVEASSDVLAPDPALRVLLYQVLREILFNVAKHAGTDRVRIVVERVDAHVRVVVEDEGVGFDPNAPAPSKGLGLPSVRERLALVGGRLDVASAPGHGTRITITVPFDPEQAF